MEAFISSLGDIAYQDVFAAVAIFVVAAIFIPAAKALNDALSKAIYGLVTSRVTQASISLGGLNVKLRSLEDIDKDRNDPEYLRIIEERIQDLKDTVEGEGRTRALDFIDDDELGWRDVFRVSRDRLVSETDRLQSRSQANLLFGVTTSLLGVVLLIFLLFMFPPELGGNDWKEVIIQYGPRVTLVLIVELISAFFLRLYVSNENDIKLNKNEITNVEMRFASVLMVETNRSSKSRLAEILGREERNFVLKKGERAVGENVRDEVRTILGSIAPLLTNEKGKKG